MNNNNKKLAGKAALVTGVSRRNGIGYGISKRLAMYGANLFLHSFTPFDIAHSNKVDENEIELIYKSLTEYGISVKQLEADFSNENSPGKVFNSALKQFKNIDILVINHTFDSLKYLEDLTSSEIDMHLSVNIRASILLVQEFAKQHDGRTGGRIIMLTSGQHLGALPHPAYAASKGALHQLTLSFSEKFISKGITVNTVNPGPTKTYTPSDEVDKAVLKRMPQGRWGEPDDAARLIGWLVSDDAQWVTGQVINSEGGFLRG